MNKSIIIGNLTRDPEARTTGAGTSVCSFTVAVSRTFSKKDETDFIPVVTWRGLADNCAKYLTKGQKVAIIGRIQTRNYEDSNGQKRYVTEIMADEVEFLNRPGGQAPQQPKTTSSTKSQDGLFGEEVSDFTPMDDEELPF